MLELCLVILRMITESLGMKKHYDSLVENTSSVLRLMKYRVAPPSSDSVQLGLVAHTDKSALTILCQNQVQGLELLTKQGNWIQVKLPEASFIVFVGDALKAWSNGRLHAATHRVMLKGDKERYSCGVFLVPKEEVTIEVPQELIDKDHPLLYRPFKFSDYFSYFVSNITDDALELYAGL
ncbi:Oxoglutarate/iron-dependent dioxygenase [Parasponia andersonii]|uniref:Oxoglutarate/iron-dependent dioxygenase n=1 Tax=Parasponia andersonii TaxID=3476 RepID=A0A2P5CAD3_PARAD|nr:Oxoglutarate/iron-dependent dioxygenase [Parasponia andersonii]